MSNMAPITEHGIVLPVQIGEGYDRVSGTVALDLRCSDCEGTGLVINPEVEAWWTGFEAYHAKRQAAGFGDRSGALTAWEALEGNAPSPAELGCGECESKGWVLTPAGSAILALVSRHLSPS